MNLLSSVSCKLNIGFPELLNTVCILLRGFEMARPLEART
jgi:hypothetical protein